MTLINRLQDANARLATATVHAQLFAEEAAARQGEYRRLSSRPLTLQDEERRRLALDLHDSTGQSPDVRVPAPPALKRPREVPAKFSAQTRNNTRSGDVPQPR